LNTQERPDSVWSKKRLGIVFAICSAYALWFNVLDSALYCVETESGEKICKSVGNIFGGSNLYQPWNMIGHFIPVSFVLLFRPLKLQLLITGFLISTTVMDSPLWGIVRLWHGLPLWHSDQAPTFSIVDWINYYYYNPLGLYPVWDSSWLIPGFPNAASIFWSVVCRTAAIIFLIWWQNKPHLVNNFCYRLPL
jgi:hypothetical protein